MAAMTLQCPKCEKFFLVFDKTRQVRIEKAAKEHGCSPLCETCEDKLARDSKIFLVNHTQATQATARNRAINKGWIIPRRQRMN